jgi:zinc and cadmium transporter
MLISYLSSAPTIWQIVLATSAISLIALITAWLMANNIKVVKRFLPGLIALAAGTMLAAAFLHLLPEAAHVLPIDQVFQITLFSIIFFFFLEKIFAWSHCHNVDCPDHSVGYLNLIGDAIHNFLDGLVIAAAFIVDPWLGFITTLAVAFHEIPQEIGDFGILLLARFSRLKVISLNFIIATTVILGALTGYYFQTQIGSIAPYLLPIAAANFIYLSASDLIPEIKGHQSNLKSWLVMALFLSGIGLVWTAIYLQPEHTHNIDDDNHQHYETEMVLIDQSDH